MCYDFARQGVFLPQIGFVCTSFNIKFKYKLKLDSIEQSETIQPFSVCVFVMYFSILDVAFLFIMIPKQFVV